MLQCSLTAFNVSDLALQKLKPVVDILNLVLLSPHGMKHLSLDAVV